MSVLTESGKKGRCFFSPHTSFAPCKTDFEKKILTVLQCIKRLDPFRISLCCLNEAFSTSIADHGIFAVNSHLRDLYLSYVQRAARYLFFVTFFVGSQMEEESAIRDMESRELTERNDQLKRESGEMR